MGVALKALRLTAAMNKRTVVDVIDDGLAHKVMASLFWEACLEL